MSDKPETNDTHQSALSRWSQRKEAARAAQSQPSQPTEPPAASQTPADTVGEDEAPALTDTDMPAIDTLAPDSDVSAFFSPGVSDALRRKALRHLFHTSRFNVKDGLDDYDDDYTLLHPLGDTMTHDLRRQNDRLAERQRIKDEQAQSDELAQPDAQAITESEDPTTAEAPADDKDDTSAELNNPSEPADEPPQEDTPRA